jgi:archaellum biogenesis ATPase FlaH
MIPKGSRIFPLLPGTKDPATENGHKDAKPAPDRPGYPDKNYGLALNGDYIVVDLDKDNPERIELESGLPPTWSQKTGGKSLNGMHYLYRVPEGYKGRRIIGYKVNGVSVGDILADGYIVGPNSFVMGKYTMVDNIEPVLAPEWLLELGKAVHTESSVSVPVSCDGITENHDNSLSLGLFLLAQNLGLTKPALKKVLREGLYSVLEGVDPSDPYTEDDDERLTSSAVSKGTYKPMQLVEEGWRTITDTERPIVQWHIQDFVPKGELVLQYGKGGIGKSTWISHLAAKAVKRGLKVGVASTEESVERFVVRAHLSDKSLKGELLNIVDIGNTWRFPVDAEAFRKKLEKYPLDIIYFDSIYAHFENNEGFSNAAEKARACLSPLASIAQELGVTIIGTFHEGKNEKYLGSTEMMNVSRVLLHATRVGEGVLKVKVEKTNFNQPNHGLNMLGGLMGAESVTGKPWLEQSEEGVISQTQLYVVTEYVKTTGEDETEYELPPEKASRNERVLNMIDKGISYKDISEELGISLGTISNIKNK